MQRWDYLTAQVESHGFNHEHLAVRYVNGTELKDWKKTSLHAFISQLGIDGWEMTGTMSPHVGGAAFTNYLFFKRPHP